MNIEHIECKDVMGHICDSLNEDIDSPRCKAIKEHLGECSECTSYMKSVEMTIDFFRKEKVDLPEGAHERLMKALDLDSIK